MSFVPPKTYTAYAFTKVGGALEKLAVDWKDPESGEIVVKVLACGVCHRSVYQRQLILLN
jgi:D-arabinose 1-dehydrogenase-like Zn-dependent alcohol dehydrogenase